MSAAPRGGRHWVPAHCRRWHNQYATYPNGTSYCGQTGNALPKSQWLKLSPGKQCQTCWYHVHAVLHRYGHPQKDTHAHPHDHRTMPLP